VTARLRELAREVKGRAETLNEEGGSHGGRSDSLFLARATILGKDVPLLADALLALLPVYEEAKRYRRFTPRYAIGKALDEAIARFEEVAGA
jgi:hypothetical protein